MTRYPLTTAFAAIEHRPRLRRRSATYHRLAAASRDLCPAGTGRATVLPTRLSLLQRARHTLGL